jgi:hypothetical protein
MGMFFDVLSAINNPDLQGNVTQLETTVAALQQFAGQNNISPSTLETMMSALGGIMQGQMRQQSGVGASQLAALFSQGREPVSGATSWQSLMPPQMQQQVAQTLSQKTGMNPSLVQAALPTLIPAVMGLLQMGNPKPGASRTTTNPLLTAFLDRDRDGDTDLGDVFKFANRFINPSQVR